MKKSFQKVISAMLGISMVISQLVPVTSAIAVTPTPTPSQAVEATPTVQPTVAITPVASASATPTPSTPSVTSVQAGSGPTVTATPALTATPNPTATPFLTQALVATASATTTVFSVFDEQLATGWEDWSWSSQNNFADTTHPYAGTKALDWKTTGAWAGLFLHTATGYDTTGQTAITFALQSTKVNPTIVVQLYDTTDKGIGQSIAINGYIASTSGAYSVYVIPLADLGAKDVKVNGLHVQDVSGEVTNEFYVDAVGFTGSAPQVTPSPTQPVPTPTSVITITPTPQPVNGTVYKDALSPGWQNWSWDATLNLASTQPVYAGTNAITYTAKAAWSGMDIHNPAGFATGTYNTLRFALQATATGQHYAIFLTDASGTQLTTPVALSTQGGDPTPGTWTVYNVPLSTLQGTNKTITGIVIHDISGAAQSVVSVDEMQFVTLTQDVAVITSGVPNNSVEQVSSTANAPIAWHTNSWGTNTAIFTYLTTGHTGTHSVKTEITKYTNGDAKWYYDAQPVVAGKQYTFKNYYQSNVVTRMTIEFGMNDGTFSYMELSTAPASAAWKQYSASFTAPSLAKTMTVLPVISAVGYLIVDDYQVTNYVPVALKRGLVSITFDDGIASQYTKAYPVLTKYNMLATFYLISGSLNTDFFMTTTQAKKLKSSGHELASHTVTHPNLTTLSAADLDRELSKSQKDLKALFGGSFLDFCSPYGLYNDAVIANIKKYYSSHRSVEPGYNSLDSFNVYDIKVQNVYTNTLPAEVTAWVAKAKKDKTWLVLVYHQVDNPEDEYSVSTKDFDKHLAAIKSSGLTVLTMEKAIAEVKSQL